MNNTGRIALGIALGAAIGAAITYLSDRDKRDRLYDDLSTTADRTRDSLVEGYYAISSSKCNTKRIKAPTPGG